MAVLCGVSMDVTIVGGGLWGLSTAWALLRQGAMSITIIDQGPIPNPIASSYDQHRLIRYPYDEQDGYSLLVDDAYMAWNNLWRDLRISHYVETGSLCLAGSSPHDWTSKSRHSLDRVGKKYDVWTPTEIQRVCPQLNLDGIRYGIILPQGGVLLADRILTDLTQNLRRAHDKFRQNETVREIDPLRRRVILADNETIQSDGIVVCVGAWAGKLLPQLSKRLTPKRQCVVYLKSPPEHEAAWNRAPSIVDTGSVDGYAIPPVAGNHLKMGWLPHAHADDPASPRTAHPNEAEGMLEKLNKNQRGKKQKKKKKKQ